MESVRTTVAMNTDLAESSYPNATENYFNNQLLIVNRSVLITSFVIRGCICILGTLSNLLFILAFIKEKKLRTSCNCLIGHFAFVNLLICCFVLPMRLSARAGKMSFGSCQLEKWLTAFLPHLSVQAQCLISCNRYFLVTKPRFVYNKWFTRRRVLLYIAAGWTFAAACVVLVDVFTETPKDKTTENCEATTPITGTRKLNNYILWLLRFIYFGITLGFYGILIRFLRRITLTMRRKNRREAKASVTFFFLLLVFATCFIVSPIALCVMSQIKENSRNSITYFFKECFRYLIQLNYCVIIVLYGYKVRYFKDAIKGVFLPGCANKIDHTSKPLKLAIINVIPCREGGKLNSTQNKRNNTAILHLGD